MTATHTDVVSPLRRLRATVEPHWRPLVPGAIAIVLMIVWAVHNGGYDADTWYWGALVILGVLATTTVALGGWWRIRLPRPAAAALAAFAAYVVWSYASTAWAQSPGDALQGSNRALLYLLVFTLMLILPWTAQGALVAVTAFALAIGAIALLILLRLASANQVAQLVIDGRLASPTGYFNSTTALFSIGAVLGIVLAARSELPGLLRGVLIAMASAGLQLAVIGQSRGWLFTLPIVAVAVTFIVRDRLRVAAATVLPVAAAVIPVHRLLGVFDSNVQSQLNHAASRAGRAGLMLCAATLALGTLIAWAEQLLRPRGLSARSKRVVGAGLIVLAVLVGGAGFTAATHGDPFGFVSRQWRGFSRPPTAAPTGSHFATVGSGRYDFWRVSLDAVLAHPIGGLGQDNFGDYYITRRRTSEEPSWTHSFEMRLLAHTGFVGFLLFAAFLGAALTGLAATRRRGSPLASATAGAAAVPLLVWLIHGSVDWFWEFPALTGPAVGFLGMAIALGIPRAEAAGSGAAVPAMEAPWEAESAAAEVTAPAAETAASVPESDPPESQARGADPPLVAPPRGQRGIPVGVGVAGGAVALVALVLVLGFPYLSVREVSLANNLRSRNPGPALRDLTHAAALNPLSPTPGRLGGTIALTSGALIEAEHRFRQAIDREHDGWYAWFGDGLAASALGDDARAKHDYQVAASINSQNAAVKAALARVDGLHPVTPSEGLAMLTLVR